ncbi:MAG: hypothetical protein AAGB30_10740 [Pedobacter sp.]
MKHCIYVIMLGILILSCSFYRKERLTAIDFFGNSQYFDRNQLINLPTHVKMISSNEINLYIIDTKNTNRSFALGKNGEIINNGITGVDSSMNYYVAKKDAKFGLMYTGFKKSFAQKFNVDSLVTYSNLGKENAKSFASNFEKLVFSSRDHHKKIAIEKFRLPEQPNGADSIYRFFNSDFTITDFSLSKELDERYQTKLVKIVFISNEKMKEGILVPRLETFYEIRQSEINNKEEILSLFKQFDADAKKQGL